MQKRRLSIAGAILVMVGAAFLPATQDVPVAQGATAGKKVCKTVKKHGKKTKVCHKAKPIPKAPATATPAPTATATSVATSTPLIANPLSVTPHEDESRTASADIGTGGGSLTARSVDGTVFSLTIPANALPETRTITIVPVTGFDGFPYSGGLVAAVLLQPEGLQLAQPAELTVVPSQPIPVDQQIPSMSTGDGQDFHLYPAGMTSAEVTMKLFHFSIAAVGKGSSADVLAMLGRVPAGPAAQIEQYGGAVAITAVRGDLAEPNLGKLLLAGAQSSYPKVVADLQAAFNQDWIAAGRATDQGLGWIRSLAIVGVGDQLKSQQANIEYIITKLIASQYTKALQGCQQQHEVGIFLALARAARVLDLGGLEVVNLATIQDGLDKCIRFDLDYQQNYMYHSTLNSHAGPVTNTGQNDGTTSSSVSHLALRVDAGTASTERALFGVQPLVFAVQGSGYAKGGSSGQIVTDCAWTTSGGRPIDPMRVVLGIDYRNNQIDNNHKLLPPQIILSVDPGNAQGQKKTHCSDYNGTVQSDTTADDLSLTHRVGFAALYSNNANPRDPKNPDGPTTYDLKDWAFVGGDIFAVEDRKVTKQTAGDSAFNFTAEGHWVLRHVPAG